MDNYIDPKKYPEWYSAKYTKQDKEIIRKITSSHKNIFIDNNNYQ